MSFSPPQFTSPPQVMTPPLRSPGKSPRAGDWQRYIPPLGAESPRSGESSIPSGMGVQNRPGGPQTHKGSPDTTRAGQVTPGRYGTPPLRRERENRQDAGARSGQRSNQPGSQQAFSAVPRPVAKSVGQVPPPQRRPSQRIVSEHGQQQHSQHSQKQQQHGQHGQHNQHNQHNQHGAAVPMPAARNLSGTDLTGPGSGPGSGSTPSPVSQRTASGASTRSKEPKVCGKCGKPIIGTLVRAMDNTYHIECFTCHDCGKPCSDKFFAEEIDGVGAVPLCEYDYFRRIDLICYTCNKAIRGAYITAVGRKYHPEHFYCDVCHKVFETEDYYEHGGKIYCHYHYSQLYAARCETCGAAILKQYVEMHRGGRDQQWHPECFMIHKFWGVDVKMDCIGVDPKLLTTSAQDASLEPKVLFDIERRIERLTMAIWLTLSEFEESCATSISDMLHAATTNNKQLGLLATGRLVLKIECLFKGIDILAEQARNAHIHIDYSDPRFRRMSPLTKEPRSLSSKLMSYLQLLRDADDSRLDSPDYSRQLLTLVSTLAHYIKLISRSSLMHALEYNRLTRSTQPTDRYLREISVHDSVPDNVFPLDIGRGARDQCAKCGESIEAQCYRLDDQRWHPGCFSCGTCGKNLANASLLGEIGYNTSRHQVLCDSCAPADPDARTGFQAISRYSQLVYLLKIALMRTRHAMKKRNYLADAASSASDTTSTRTALSHDDDYSRQVNDIKRMRSRRQDRKVGTATNEVRKSVILEAPQASSAQEDVNLPSIGTDGDANFVRNTHRSLGRRGSKRLRIEDVPMESKAQNVNLGATSNLLKNEKGLTLDDIPRIVSSEQAREYRPNAFRFQKRNFESKASTLPTPKTVNTKPGEAETEKKQLESQAAAAAQPNTPTAKRYSELSTDEHDVMRLVAAFALHETMGDTLSLEDCVSFVDSRRNTSIWGRLFGGKKGSGSDKKIFGAPLEATVVRYGVDSDLGIGPEKLRIPMMVDEIINAMRSKDLSAEGIFRLNGNIRRLKKVMADIDAHPNTVPDLYTENAIQLSALLKRYARDLPDPLLTFKLYDVFVLSHKYATTNPEKRDRILQLAYAMLPKVHRDLTEVLLFFLNWVATFAQVDEETGSKMDVHNLATVLTPNILYAKPKNVGSQPNAADLIPNGENHFLAIEVVNTMIEKNEELSRVPPDLCELYHKAGLESASDKLTAKDIIAKCRAACDANPGLLV